MSYTVYGPKTRTDPVCTRKRKSGYREKEEIEEEEETGGGWEEASHAGNIFWIQVQYDLYLMIRTLVSLPRIWPM